MFRVVENRGTHRYRSSRFASLEDAKCERERILAELAHEIPKGVTLQDFVDQRLGIQRSKRSRKAVEESSLRPNPSLYSEGSPADSIIGDDAPLIASPKAWAKPKFGSPKSEFKRKLGSPNSEALLGLREISDEVVYLAERLRALSKSLQTVLKLLN